MTIFFSEHDYKYEVEGVAKLFFPVEKFKHEYRFCTPEDKNLLQSDDIILTRAKKGAEFTYLWVFSQIATVSSHHCMKISNSASDYSDECERMLCIALYHVLQKLTGITPRWGILTGVRPVSSVLRLRKSGMTDLQLTEFLKERYLVCDDKIKLAILVANNQSEMLRQTSDNSYSLYVSIPFCPSRCSYCSFVSHAINTKSAIDKIDEYLGLLCIEIAETAKLAQHLKLDSIYIGGGTPTALTAPQIKLVTDAISANFDVSHATEYTIEAGRADSITPKKLEVIQQSGATRISINPQTFNDLVLEEIGRNHTALQVKECYALAQDMGFTNINMDFIAGLPTDTLDSFKDTINTAIALSPSCITVHTLSVKRSSDLFDSDTITSYAKTAPTPQMTQYAQQALITAGYQPYYLYRQKNTIGNLENVGYAKPGALSYYNVHIMDDSQTILACGAGGATKLVGEGAQPIKRIFNFKYHYEYIDRFDEIMERKSAIAHHQPHKRGSDLIEKKL